MLPSRLRFWLRRTFALADGIETFASSTIGAKRRALGSEVLPIFLLRRPNANWRATLQMKFWRRP